MKPITLHPFSALAGGAFAVLALLALGAGPQQGIARVGIVGPVTVSPPQIVNVESITHPSADEYGFITCPPGNTPIYEVPMGKALVITNWKAEAESFLSLAEESASVTTIKLSGCQTPPSGACFSPNIAEADFVYPMGILFRSGSSVVIANPTPVSDKMIGLRFTGYLVDE